MACITGAWECTKPPRPELVIGKLDVDGGYRSSTIRMTPAELRADPMSLSAIPFSYIDRQAAASVALVFHAQRIGGIST